MKVLQLTAHFPPNIGGVETHLSDLCKSLAQRGIETVVLTYRPLQTKAEWGFFEKGKNIEVIRLPWIPNLFYLLVKYPFLEFIYLLPGLFCVLPFLLIQKKIEVIHAHGLVAGSAGVFWGKIFSKRVVVSLHSIYHFPKEGLYRNFVRWIFNNADYCLGLSKQSAAEIKSLGVSPKKVSDFVYWIDLKRFKAKGTKSKAKKQLGWSDKFTVLFVGRLVEEKGILVLLESVRGWDRNINLKIIGLGPLEVAVKKAVSGYDNVTFVGAIDQDKLPLYYSGSDILIVPSISEEGFGRVILEALSCGTPVIGANCGAIPEAIDTTVGRLIDVNPRSIKEVIERFFIKKDKLKKMEANCRKFAERRYSEKNVRTIINAYQF